MTHPVQIPVGAALCIGGKPAPDDTSRSTVTVSWSIDQTDSPADVTRTLWELLSDMPDVTDMLGDETLGADAFTIRYTEGATRVLIHIEDADS